ncbi:MAG: PKD domain-containing protein, partial [Halobacteriovoraceae bacterium]|nr:PKD domain-containing protein [Halobacteriovoraceae bacterium]
WDFGDGTVGVGSTTEHIFLQKGNFTVSLTVTDDNNETGTISKNILVSDTPTAVILADIVVGKAPLVVNLNGSGSFDNDGVVSNYSWSFGDGSSDSGVQVTKNYEFPGTYNVKLAVVDDTGRSNTSGIEIVVLPNDITFSSRPPNLAISNSKASYIPSLVFGTTIDPLALVYELEVSPEGMVIDDLTGEITWTPNSSQEGSHDVKINVTDGTYFSSQNFSYLVKVPVTIATKNVSSINGGVLEVANSNTSLDGLQVTFPPGALAFDQEISIGIIPSSGTSTPEFVFQTEFKLEKEISIKFPSTLFQGNKNIAITAEASGKSIQLSSFDVGNFIQDKINAGKLLLDVFSNGEDTKLCDPEGKIFKVNQLTGKFNFRKIAGGFSGNVEIWSSAPETPEGLIDVQRELNIASVFSEASQLSTGKLKIIFDTPEAMKTVLSSGFTQETYGKATPSAPNMMYINSELEGSSFIRPDKIYRHVVAHEYAHIESYKLLGCKNVDFFTRNDNEHDFLAEGIAEAKAYSRHPKAATDLVQKRFTQLSLAELLTSKALNDKDYSNSSLMELYRVFPFFASTYVDNLAFWTYVREGLDSGDISLDKYENLDILNDFYIDTRNSTLEEKYHIFSAEARFPTRSSILGESYASTAGFDGFFGAETISPKPSPINGLKPFTSKGFIIPVRDFEDKDALVIMFDPPNEPEGVNISFGFCPLGENNFSSSTCGVGIGGTGNLLDSGKLTYYNINGGVLSTGRSFVFHVSNSPLGSDDFSFTNFKSGSISSPNGVKVSGPSTLELSVVNLDKNKATFNVTGNVDNTTDIPNRGKLFTIIGLRYSAGGSQRGEAGRPFSIPPFTTPSFTLGFKHNESFEWIYKGVLVDEHGLQGISTIEKKLIVCSFGYKIEGDGCVRREEDDISR